MALDEYMNKFTFPRSGLDHFENVVYIIGILWSLFLLFNVVHINNISLCITEHVMIDAEHFMSQSSSHFGTKTTLC